MYIAIIFFIVAVTIIITLQKRSSKKRAIENKTKYYVKWSKPLAETVSLELYPDKTEVKKDGGFVLVKAMCRRDTLQDWEIRNLAYESFDRGQDRLETYKFVSEECFWEIDNGATVNGHGIVRIPSNDTDIERVFKLNCHYGNIIESIEIKQK